MSARAQENNRSVVSTVDRVADALFATSRQIEHGAIMFRLTASAPLALLFYSSRSRLPYWEIAVAAVAVMLAANIWLYVSHRKETIPPPRSALIGSVVDTVLLLLVSHLAIRASAVLSTTSEMWLVFPLVILAFVYRSKPLVGIAYSALLTAWYVTNILAFFDMDARAVTELPIRATFFVLMGGLAAILGNSLRQQSPEK